MKKSAIDRAITYFENLTPQTVEQYEAAHDAMACLREAKKDKARLDWMLEDPLLYGHRVHTRRLIDRAMKNTQ